MSTYETFGCRLDKFAIAGFKGDPLPETEDFLELQAYQIGRNKAGRDRLQVVSTKEVQARSRDAFKTLQVVGA